MPANTVEVTRRGRIAEIALRNPPLNLMTMEMLGDLRRAVVEVGADESLRCVIVHSGGARAFSAGSDMREFHALAGDATAKKILPEDHVLRLLAAVPVPTIAAIDGPALGGGLELALACDLRVADVDSVLGAPEARIGGLAGSGSQRLTRLIGPSRAMELLFLGDTISSTQALDWGLVNRVATAETALQLARRLADEIASRGRLSLRLAKALVASAQDDALDAGLSRAVRAQELIFASDDLQEGANAFLEKRSPTFG